MNFHIKPVSDFCVQPCVNGGSVVVDASTGHTVTASMPRREAEYEADVFNRAAAWPDTLNAVFGGRE